jgi:hypothetical protein
MTTVKLNFVFVAAALSLMTFGCKPNANQQKILSNLEKLVVVIDQEVLLQEGKQTYLSKDQEEFEAKNKSLKKELGKQDSVYNALTKAHRKTVDLHSEKLALIKESAEKSRSLIEKLNQPLNFTYSTLLIEEDAVHFDTTFTRSKPEFEKAMIEHERIESLMTVQLSKIDSIKTATLLAAKSQATPTTKKTIVKLVTKSSASKPYTKIPLKKK